jgi:hypothetical protein
MEYGNNPPHEVLSEPLSDSRSQCSKIAYYKAFMTKKLSVGPALSRSAVVGLKAPVQSYEQKVEELRIQQTKLNDYLETLSKMLAARQQGKVAAFTVRCNFLYHTIKRGNVVVVVTNIVIPQSDFFPKLESFYFLTFVYKHIFHVVLSASITFHITSRFIFKKILRSSDS